MPSWKRVLTSGSDAQLNSVYVPGPAINRLTASVAITALNTYNSTALNSGTVQRIDSASVTWSIQHNLNEFWPIVYVWQEDPDYVYTPVLTDQVKVVSQNEIQITFPTATRGYVNISRAGHIVSGSVPWTNLVGPADVTASLNIYGNVIANQGFTGSLWGTSSWSTSSISSSYSESSSLALSASWAISSSRAISASWAISSSRALTSSLSLTSSYPFYVTGSSILSYGAVAPSNVNNNSVLIGSGVGSNADSGNSVMIGNLAGSAMTGLGNSNILLGPNAARSAISSSSNIAIGIGALQNANIPWSNVAIGTSAGSGVSANRVRQNVIIGNTAGTNMTTVNDNVILGTSTATALNRSSGSVFIGQRVGQNVTGSENIFIGRNAGSYSTANYRSKGNIIIGTSIGLPENTTNRLNIGGVIFGSGVNFVQDESTGSAIFTGALGGMIGINQVTPSYSLDVSGTFRVTGGMTGSLHGTASWAENVTSSSYAYTASSAISSSFSDTSISASYSYTASSAISASWAISSSRAISSLSSSYAYTASSAISASYAETASYASNITITGSIFGVDYIDFDTSSAYTYAAGRLGWDNGENTLQLGLSGGNVTYSVGEQIVQLCYNAEATTITKGQVVYISGSQGNKIAVKLATNNREGGSFGTLGFAAEDITSGGQGWVMTEGNLRKLNTATLTPGALLYLGATPGTYTETIPTAPSHSVRLGYVERVHASVGTIYVKIDNGYEIGELHDIVDTTTTSSYGQLMVKSGSVWVTTNQLTGSYGITGSLTANSFTGSLFGTSSWSNNSISSSYSYTASSAISSSWATSASRAITSLTSSYSLTASFAPAYLPLTGGTINGDLYINGTASIAYLNVTYESSSVIYSSGSNQFGDATNDVHRFVGTVIMSGSQQITGSLTAPDITGSLQGTSSWSTNSISASYAYTASSAISSSYAYTASSAISSSVANSSISSSYAFTASSAISASWAVSSSRAISSVSASYSYTASSATSASFAQTSSNILGGVTNSIAIWNGVTSLSSSAIYQSSSNIGIGTTTPTEKLTVRGNGAKILIESQTSPAGYYAYLQSNYDTTNPFVLNSQGFNILGSKTGISSAAGQTTYLNSYYDLSLNTAGSTASSSTSRLFISQSGNVGIGTTTPNAKLDVNGNAIVTGSLIVTLGVTSSLFGTSSWAQNVTSASYAFTASSAISASIALTASFLSGSVTSASYAFTASSAISSSFSIEAISASWAISSSRAISSITSSFALTSSFVNRLEQSVVISGSLTVGQYVAGASENTLTVGPAPNGGVGEGGQILLAAVGGTYTTASMIDNYQNKFRVLRGTNTGSDAFKMQIDMHTGQVQIPNYNSSTAFTGSSVATLGVDSNGNIITTSGGSSTSVTLSRVTASYTFALSDAGKTIEVSGSTNITYNLTVPPASTTNFADGAFIDVILYGTGSIQFVTGSGVTFRSANNWTKLGTRYGAVSLINITGDEWYLIGNLNA